MTKEQIEKIAKACEVDVSYTEPGKGGCIYGSDVQKSIDDNIDYCDEIIFNFNLTKEHYENVCDDDDWFMKSYVTNMIKRFESIKEQLIELKQLKKEV